jgi:hypothetical protein
MYPTVKSVSTYFLMVRSMDRMIPATTKSIRPGNNRFVSTVKCVVRGAIIWILSKGAPSMLIGRFIAGVMSVPN